VLATLSVETRPAIRKDQSFVVFDEDYYFGPGWHISTLKHSFHFMLRAEFSARHFPRRNKPCNAQNTIIRRFLRKLPVISFLIRIFRCSNALFVPFYLPNLVHATFSVE
jgi:hypothetical protein